MADRILIIDDDLSQRQLLSSSLEKRFPSAHVLSAGDAEAGLGLAREHVPHVVLLDVRLPGMDGFEACAQIKRDPSTSGVPVLMISAGFIDADFRANGIACGAHACICKPFEMDELMAQVRALMRLKQDEENLRESQHSLRKELDARTGDLQRSEERLHLLSSAVEQSTEGLAVTDLGGNLIFSNHAFAAAHGYTCEELRGKNLSIFHGPDQMPAVEAANKEILSTGEFSGEIWHTHRDGTTFPTLMHNTLLRDGDGKPIGMIGTLRDITDIKKAEEERGRLAHAVEQSAESIIITDTAGDIQYVNPGFERVSGYRAEEVIGQNPRILKSGKQPEDLYREMWETICRGDTWRGRFVNLNKDRMFYEVEQVISPIRDQRGEIVSYVSVSLDITRQTELEAEFRQAQKMESVGRLAGGIAHDFNNLLTTILGFGRLVLNQLDDEHGVRGDIEEMVHAGERAAKLTRQLLTFGRKQVLRPQCLNPNAVVAEMHQLLRRTLGEDIELVTLLEEKPGCIRADVGLIEQVIMNLAVNARDAMPRGGKLTIAISHGEVSEEYAREHIGLRPGAYVRISVSDTGAGMSGEVQEHAFEPFYTTKEAGEGTGLGLSTVYAIVQQCEGHIILNSQEDRGTTFEIYIPQMEGVAEAVRAPTYVAAPNGTETILLAEDEDTIRRLTARQLKQLGYTILEACHGEDALRIASRYTGDIHLVLTDVVMPRMGGPEMVEQLISSHPGMNVLYVSGFADSRTLDRVVSQNGSSLMMKPYTQEVLARKVREVLDRAG